MDYINEAFKSLELLTEEMFRADDEGINKLSDFMSSDVDDSDEISIIDMDAETEDDLQDSYVGKVIIECNVCHSHIFKDKEDLTLNMDGELDLEEECPYCAENNGFVIIGEISEFKPAGEEAEEIADTEEPVEEPAEEVSEEQPEAVDAEEVIEESLNVGPRKFKPHTMKLLRMIGSDLVNDAVEEKLEESFNNVSIETDDQKMTMTSEENGKVTVTTEPIEEAPIAEEGEMITPISPETEAEIMNANSEVIDEEPAEEPAEETIEEIPADAEEMDFEIDEFDEDSMNELGESYLHNVYENVDSFKTSNISTTGNKLIIEGVINFKSGNSKKTGFIFEAKEATRDGKVKFMGENAHFSRGKRAFTLSGSLNEKKLMVESLTYNYRAKNSDGKSTRVYGTVTRNK